MKFFETSKYYTLKKSTYITLRWIGIIGQLLSINIVYFYLKFDFDFIISNLIIFIGVISNLFLIFFYKKTQLSERSALIFLTIDLIQLTVLVFLTGGVVNPFIIFLRNCVMKYLPSLAMKSIRKKVWNYDLESEIRDYRY